MQRISILSVAMLVLTALYEAKFKIYLKLNRRYIQADILQCNEWLFLSQSLISCTESSYRVDPSPLSLESCYQVQN